MRILVILLKLGVAFVLFGLTWPVSPIFLGVFVVRAFANKQTGVLAKAITGIAEPLLRGLLVLGLLQLLLNFLRPDAQSDAVNFTEHAILGTQAILKYTKPSFSVFALLLAVLVILAAYGPRWPYVTRTLWAKKHLGKLSSTLAVVASFSFCANAAVLEPQRRKVVTHLQASYRRAEDRKLTALERYVRAQVIETALQQLDSRTLAGTRGLLAGLNGLDGVSSAGKAEVVTDIAREQLLGVTAPVRMPRRPTPSLGADPLAELARERAAVTRAEHLASEAEKAAKAVLEDRLDLGPSELVDLAWNYLEAFGAPADGLIASTAKKLGEKLLSAFVERWTDPVKDELAERWVAGLSKVVETQRDATQWALFAHARAQALFNAHMAEAAAAATRARNAASDAHLAYLAKRGDRGDAALELAQREAALAEHAASAAKNLDAGERPLAAAGALVLPRTDAVAVAVDAAKAAAAAREAAVAAREAAAAAEAFRAAQAAEEVGPALRALAHVIP